MRGRKLKLLLINDQDVGIGTDQLEVVPCPTGFDKKPIFRLAHWPQHMYLWANNAVPRFDLLLIDIKFEQDTYDPDYFGEVDPKGEGAVNPFGLLHALPLAARQDLANMPFVWGIHSGDPSKVKDDPVAIWAFGLLWAMERRKGWDGYDNTDQIPQYFSQQIANLPALLADAAWPQLVKRYREKLTEACLADRLYIQPDNLNKLISSFENARSDLNGLEKETLDLFAGYDDDALSIRSLFADFGTWDITIQKEILAFLGSPMFCAGDFIDLDNLVIKLGDPVDPLSKFLLERLSQPTKELLNLSGNRLEMQSAVRNALIDDLNAILKGELIYKEPRFAHVKLSEETQSLIVEHALGESAVYLNRQLLEQAYPYEIAKRQCRDGLQAALRKQENLFQQVRDTIAKLRGDPNADLKLKDALPQGDQRNTIAVAVIICLWLEKFIKDEKRKAIDLLSELGYYEGKKADYVTPGRFLEYIGIRLPIKAFLRSLEREEIRNPALRECALRYWEEVLDPTKKKTSPACLGFLM